MPEDEFSLEDDADETTGGANNRTLRNQLKEANRQLQDMQRQVEEAAQVRRDLAFFQAGLPDTPMTKFFREHYSGDPTPEAVKAAASEIGLLTGDPAVAGEVAGIDAMSQVAMGAESPTVIGSAEEMQAEMAKAASRHKGPEAAFAVEEVLRRYGVTTARDLQ